MEINFFCENIKEFQFNKKIKDIIIEMCNNEKKEVGELNFIFCSDEYILKMNKKYLDHDYYTDVITFNYNEKNKISGDVFISKETVFCNADKYGTAFENELNRVMVHGVLHLIGYNDKSEEDKKEMRTKENYYLDKEL